MCHETKRQADPFIESNLKLMGKKFGNLISLLANYIYVKKDIAYLSQAKKIRIEFQEPRSNVQFSPNRNFFEKRFRIVNVGIE